MYIIHHMTPICIHRNPRVHHQQLRIMRILMLSWRDLTWRGNRYAHILKVKLSFHCICRYCSTNCLSLQENVDALISCVSRNVGFSQGKPVAALTIYKCLINWKSFEAERTSVFDCLIQMIGSAIEVIQMLYCCSFIYCQCGYELWIYTMCMSI